MSRRIIPSLQIMDSRLVKTRAFADPSYVGDPVNTVRIFNDFEIDELLVTDIRSDSPNIALLLQIAQECFMPIAYGGGIRSLTDAEAVFACGIEKVVVGTLLSQDPGIVRAIASRWGSQAVIASLDVVRRGPPWRRENCVAQFNVGIPEAIAHAAAAGCGELLVTSAERDGTRRGFDCDLVRLAASSTDLPVIASGGAGTIDHLVQAFAAGANAVALGSMVVFQGGNRSVLIHVPDTSGIASESAVPPGSGR